MEALSGNFFAPATFLHTPGQGLTGLSSPSKPANLEPLVQKKTAYALLLTAFSSPLGLLAQDAPSLNATQRVAIIEKISASIDEIYVFPDVATEMNQHLAKRLADGAYDEITSLPTFAEQLTEDLRSISHDLHLSVRTMPPRDINAEHEIDQEAMQRRYLEAQRRSNYGFQKLDRLAGNVGYLDLRGFVDASSGGETAIAAMRFLATADALIIDLRRNGGGSPSMIQLISSYFFDEPQHLNSFYIRRENTTEQYWTQAHVAGEKMIETPIYILTSGRTFSAAEEFTYNLKNMERATIIGETTGGGAHPVDMHHFPELGVQMSLPFGRAINPITGTNWEGTGIEPHISVAADEALQVAHGEALKGLAEKASEPDQKFQLTWALEGITAKRHPVVIESSKLAAYTGVYGPRKIRVEEGKLVYQREDGPVYSLVAMGEDRFWIPELDFFRVRFERDDSGAIVTLVGLYDNGREDSNARSKG
jgi:hypothetical protein